LRKLPLLSRGDPLGTYKDSGAFRRLITQTELGEALSPWAGVLNNEHNPDSIMITRFYDVGSKRICLPNGLPFAW
jgi:hypothetical protein